MKVICIDDKWEGVPGYERTGKQPVFGEICTVRELIECNGSYYYTLFEYDPLWEYETSAFAPLSDIDETELTTINKQIEVV